MNFTETQFKLNNLPGTRPVHRNLSVAQLVETSIRRNETQLADNGALVGMTGKKTGRSPGDKFVVREPSSRFYSAMSYKSVPAFSQAVINFLATARIATSSVGATHTGCKLELLGGRSSTTPWL